MPFAQITAGTPAGQAGAQRRSTCAHVLRRDGEQHGVRCRDRRRRLRGRLDPLVDRHTREVLGIHPLAVDGPRHLRVVRL